VSVQLDKYGFPQTSGIFETIKTIDGKPISLNRHMRRAIDSARDLGIAMPSEESLRDELVAVLAGSIHPVGRLRLCFWKESFSITHDEYVELSDPARVNFLSETVHGSQHKQFPYDDRFRILEAARDEGFDDSILFNRKNEVTETAISNLLLRIQDQWVTPPITAGLLPGVVRAIAIEHCGVKVRSIHISEIAEIESAFLVSSLRLAQPISHIGEMKLKIGEASLELKAQIIASSQPLSVG
jgi:branched-subunit amino acid aminotransferase/4-amino-4-deoxychorismate lyase